MSSVTQEHLNYIMLLIQQKNWPLTTEWLRGCHQAVLNENQRIILKARKKMRTVADLSLAQSLLNKSLEKNYLDDLASDMRHIRSQPITFERLQPTPATITFKLKRKNPLIFCYGDTCLKKGITLRPDEMISISCCHFHNFCRRCLVRHLTRELEKAVYQPIRCPACVAIGELKDLFIQESEIQAIIPTNEYNALFHKDASRRLLVQCDSRMNECPNKGNYLQKYRVHNFECGDCACQECYATSIERYINEVVFMIENQPGTLFDMTIGFMCPNRHIKTLKNNYSIDELKNILQFSVSNQAGKDNTLALLEKYYKFFNGKIMRHCKNCNKYSKVVNREEGDCKKCKMCFKCGKNSHPSISCDKLQELENSLSTFSELLQKPLETDKNFHLYIRAVETLKRLDLTSFRITTYMIVNISAMQKYAYDQLMLANHGTNHTYLLCGPYSDSDRAKMQIRGKIQTSHNGFCMFPKKFDATDNSALILYKVEYLNSIINRNPRSEDKTVSPQLFMNSEHYLLTNENAAIPLMIITIEKIPV